MYKIKSNILVISAAAAASMAITACTATPTSLTAPNVVQVQNMETNEITVSGSEKVSVVPDIADIEYGVTTQTDDAQTCQTKNAEESNKVIDLLKSSGVLEEMIQTGGYNLNPRYDWIDNKQILIGYEMTTSITVSGLPLDQVGKLLSDSVNAGVNYISSVNYKSSKYDESYQEALRLAFAAARRKAEAIAAASGRTLGVAANVEEQRENSAIRYNNYAAGATAKQESTSDHAVMPGELDVEAAVIVVFEVN